ncbi:peptidoglycan D,D-transpeptidase FtsI family protein [Virgibacillus sp. W0430]|uniref:peptidoglycan D,D-transpeptidase FtsI family protein n=1 Tax=Virgibacillus sp. W0430 TaxID=3391580 RepID=UPI003F48B2BC
MKKKKAQLPFRLNILFFIVFLLFSVLIVQLGIVQILKGEAFQQEIDRTIQDTTKIPVPRGKMLDRYHNVVVDNMPLYSITYTPPKGVQAEDKLELAEDLARFIAMDSDEELDRVTLRNKKEYWYLKNKEKAVARLSDEEKQKLNDVEQYDLALKRITEDEVRDFSKEELEVIAIKKELDKAFSLTPHVVKNKDVTAEEYAQVAEHLDLLPGINATTDWEREYPFEESISSFIGSITSQDQGIPADKEQYYLSRGYSRNDRVGISGLEEQYEDVLRGRKEQIQYTTTKSGKVIDSEVIVPGERGKDLILTIDMEFQQRVDEIVRDELKNTIQKFPYQNQHLEDAIAVAMNPQTGEILAISGQHYNRSKNKFEDAAFKALYDAHLPGSSIKGATVLAGYQSGVISPYQSFTDRPIKIAETPIKASYRRLGPVNDLSALKLSSNVYMYYIALRMGGEYRNPFPDNGRPTFNSDAFAEMRSYFHQFGLGVKTGIDFPYEATGVRGTLYKPGLLMDYAIGQYDTFTTLQLAQYVSTIANDGYRVKPYFVKEIREPAIEDGELGPLYKSTNPQVLNRIQMEDSEIKRVQEGFRKVFRESGGTGARYWAGKAYNAVGKTGTAENAIYKDRKKLADTENLALVGYAPMENPEIAFAIMVPHTGAVKGQYPANHKIGTRLMDAYFDLKKERTTNN